MYITVNDNPRIFIAAVEIQTAKLEVIYVSENYTIYCILLAVSLPNTHSFEMNATWTFFQTGAVQCSLGHLSMHRKC